MSLGCSVDLFHNYPNEIFEPILAFSGVSGRKSKEMSLCKFKCNLRQTFMFALKTRFVFFDQQKCGKLVSHKKI